MSVTRRRVGKLVAILLGVYIGIVALFEALLGYLQPEGEGTAVLTIQIPDQEPHDRVLALLESDGDYYVAANHWPRAWYRQALAHPEVQLDKNGEPRDYVAVPVDDDEHERLQEEHETGVLFRVVTGFPPRRFLRLDPADGA